MAKAAKPKAGNDLGGFKEWGLNTIERIGINGFLILCVVTLFFVWSTVEQKSKFIDKFILLNFTKEELPQAAIFIIFIVVAYIITLASYKRRLKDSQKRVEVLEKDNNDLRNQINKLIK